MSRLTDAPTSSAETEEAGADSMAGSEHGDQDEFRSQLNQGRRIDYMLQVRFRLSYGPSIFLCVAFLHHQLKKVVTKDPYLGFTL